MNYQIKTAEMLAEEIAGPFLKPNISNAEAVLRDCCQTCGYPTANLGDLCPGCKAESKAAKKKRRFVFGTGWFNARHKFGVGRVKKNGRPWGPNDFF